MLTIDNRPAYIDEQLWEELSPGEKIRWQRREQLQRWGLRWATRILLIPPMLYITFPPFHWAVNQALPIPGQHIRFIGSADPMASLDTSTLDDNDPVPGTEYTITSPFGWRIHPVHGNHQIHLGVDVNTPTGTQLRAPAVAGDAVTVSCWWDSKGGGNVAEITSKSIPEYRFKALHLDTCKSGVFSKGQVFASTGSTGVGTGEHLDWRQLPIESDAPIAPHAGYLTWVLTGEPGKRAPQNLRDEIKESEGYSGEAYADPGAGVPTIGYGATSYPDGTKVKLGDTISQKSAEELLDWHINKAAKDVEDVVEIPLNRNEKEALTDLSYNIGGDQLKESQLVTCLNKGDKKCAADEFLMWNNADGKVLPGLVQRREKNRELFLRPPDK